MRKYQYIGDMKRISPCKYLGIKHGFEDCCNNGSCKGHIDGECPFDMGDGVIKKFADLFVEE